MAEVKDLKTNYYGNWFVDNSFSSTINNQTYLVEENIKINNSRKGKNDSDFSINKIERPAIALPIIEKNYDISNVKNYSQKVQKWKGYVLEIFENHFEAKVFDLTNINSLYEIVELELIEVSPEDKILLKQGAVFYWAIGHFMDNGQVTKKSLVRFQRLITLDEEEIDLIQNKVDDLFDFLNGKSK